MQDNFNLSASRAAKNEKAVWERRFWEHLIRDTKDLNRHIDYIHFNPVKHGLVDSPFLWKHSSFHKFRQRWQVSTELVEIHRNLGRKSIDGIKSWVSGTCEVSVKQHQLYALNPTYDIQPGVGVGWVEGGLLAGQP